MCLFFLILPKILDWESVLGTPGPGDAPVINKGVV